MALFQTRLYNLFKYKNVLNNYRLSSTSQEKKGLVLGVYTEKEKKNIILTSGAKKYNEITGGKLLDNIKFAAGDQVKEEQSFIFWGLCDKFHSVAVVGLGDPKLDYNELEEINEGNEAVRTAVHIGCTNLKAVGVTEVHVDGMERPECAAEGASITSMVFDNYRKDKKPPLKIDLFDGDKDHWNHGLIKGNSQNLARLLADTPSNYKPPRLFAQMAKEHLEPVGVKVEIHDKKWIEDTKMGGLLSVSSGSCEPPVFLEMHYNGTDKNAPPIVFVGKGVTFDSGGYALKPAKGMEAMRGDCGGAACVVAAIKAIAQLKLKINVVGLVPLTENLISGQATKPGDVITMMNGKTVAVDNPDAEGRLILADALTYSGKFNPKFTLDIATLTGAIGIALGCATTGVFTNSKQYWEVLHTAGCISGDRMWRMPLWKHYVKLVTDYKTYDVNNIGKSIGGGACTAAAFLRQFIPKEDTPWAHLDIAGVAGCGVSIAHKYICAGINGRPTRTLVNFAECLSNK